MQNQPKLFKPNKFKSLILLLICSTFVIIGIFLREDDSILAWSGIIFFGLGIIVALIQFIPNASYLKLTDEGFEVKSLFRSHFTKWSEVKDFRIGSLRGNDMIYFDFTEQHTKWKRTKQFAKFLSRKEGGISASYDIPTFELYDLMVAFKEKSEQA